MPYTEVTASVTSYSLWNTSGVSRQAVFFSPPGSKEDHNLNYTTIYSRSVGPAQL